MSLPIPKRVPKAGFYYHYKHDPKGEFNNYVYEVVGVALHTESKDYEVIYRALYDNVFSENVNFYSRPLDIFIEDVTKDGKTFPRFVKVTDSVVIEKLEKIKKEMYL